MTTAILKATVTGVTEAYSYFAQPSELIVEYLDPMCTLVTLGLFAYKPENSKLGIRNNHMTIQDPTFLVQGLQRAWNREDRGDLHHLRAPILFYRGVELGYVTISSAVKLPAEHLDYLTRTAIAGLTKMRQTYENSLKSGSMVKNCLDDYIKTLSQPMTKAQYEEEVNKLKPTMFIIYQEFMKQWELRDLHLIIGLFAYMDPKQVSEYNNYVANAIANFIASKEIKINSVRPG
jgi:uncharacterized membrane protein